MFRRPVVPLWLTVALGLALAGCGHGLPLRGSIHTQTDARAQVSGDFTGSVEVRLPAATDPGPMVPVVVRPAAPGLAPGSVRVALIDVDGLLVNQNQTGLYSVGENPVSAFREKLEAAAADPAVRAVVLRIDSPGGGVTASDILAEELRRFRVATGKPAVACLMDVATGGAYYLAVGCDRVIAHPTSLTGAVGALVNHVNLEDAMAQFNIRYEPVKSGELVDMGTVTAPLPDEVRDLLQAMADGFRQRFEARIRHCRPQMTPDDLAAIADGRVVAAPQALELRMIDAVGYVEDAIGHAEHLAGIAGAEVVLYQRPGAPTRSIYAVTPNTPIQGELIPISYPGLERSKLPTFLYLWQPDPTITRLGGR